MCGIGIATLRAVRQPVNATKFLLVCVADNQGRNHLAAPPVRQQARDRHRLPDSWHNLCRGPSLGLLAIRTQEIDAWLLMMEI